MLKRRHFTISWKILAHFSFDGIDTSQKSWSRGNKRLEKSSAQIKSKWRSVWQLIRLIGNRTGTWVVRKRAGCKDGQRFANLQQPASTICGTISGNVSRHKIAKTLKIPPSTVHDIIRRFREPHWWTQGHFQKSLSEETLILGETLHVSASC